jgi:hypothetical protein
MATGFRDSGLAAILAAAIIILLLAGAIAINRLTV